MYKVLLIDDEQWVLEDLKYIIDWESHGYTIHDVARNTREARRSITKCQPDLIICDIRMPNENGIDFLRHLRNSGNDVYLIFLTALSEFSCAKEAVNLNAFSYLLKPVEGDALEEELEKVKKALVHRNKVESLVKFVDSKMGNDSDIITMMKKDILERYSEKLQLNDYAKEHYMNASYLSQLFKQDTGQSFTNYVLHIRLTKAEQLLRETPLSISDISESVGYTDYGHFSKLFKKYKGVSPKSYRKGCS